MQNEASSGKQSPMTYELIRLPGNDLKTVRLRYLSFPCILALEKVHRFFLINH